MAQYFCPEFVSVIVQRWFVAVSVHFVRLGIVAAVAVGVKAVVVVVVEIVVVVVRQGFVAA